MTDGKTLRISIGIIDYCSELISQDGNGHTSLNVTIIDRLNTVVNNIDRIGQLSIGFPYF